MDRAIDHIYIDYILVILHVGRLNEVRPQWRSWKCTNWPGRFSNTHKQIKSQGDLVNDGCQ